MAFQYRRQLLYQSRFIPFARQLINLVSSPLDVASFISRLGTHPPSRSLPEQETINILGGMIRALASHASSILSTPLNSTGIAIPNYFTAHDISLAVSALAFADLTFTPSDWRLGQSTSVAGMVWQGIGICTDYRNRETCDLEYIPRETVLFVSFTDAALGLTLRVSGQAPSRKPFKADELHLELGLRALQNKKLVSGRMEKVDEDGQVACLQAAIKDFLTREQLQPTKIVLMGDQTHQAVFQNAVRDSLAELHPIHGHYLPAYGETDSGEEKMMYPVFAGARGAAEMAKRAMESTPGGCLEAVQCYRDRGE